MTVTVVNSISYVSLYHSSSSGTLSVALPASLQPNDIVVVSIRAAVGATLTTPTGWTLLGSVSFAAIANVYREYLFLKNSVSVADSSATVAISYSGGSGNNSYYSSTALRVSGRYGAFISATTVAANTQTGQLVTMPSITASTRELLIVGYGGSYGSIGGFTTPSGLTLATNTNGYEAIHYQELAGAGSNSATDIGWGFSVTNTAAGVVAARVQLLLSSDTVVETVGVTGTPAGKWTAGTTLAEALGMRSTGTNGQTYADALSAATAFTDAPTADLALAMVDPVDNRQIFRNFREVTPTYASAKDAYNAWCVSAGVSSSGTAYSFSVYNDEYVFYDLGFSPIYYASSNYLFVAASGNVSLFRAPPTLSVTSNADVVANGVGWTVAYTRTPVYDTPTLTFGLVDNDYAYTHLESFQIRSAPTGEAMLYFVTVSEKSGQPDKIGFAVRLRPGYIEMVVTPISTAIQHPHSLVFVTGNPSTQMYAVGKTLKSSFPIGTTYQFLSDDLGYLSATISQSIATAANMSAKWSGSTSVSGAVRLMDPAVMARGIFLTQTTGFSDATVLDIRYAELLAETINLVDAHVLRSKLSSTMLDNVRLADAIMRVFPVAQAEGVALTDVVRVVQAVRVAEGLGLLDVTLSKSTIYRTFAELLRVSDVLRRFLSGDALDGIGVAAATVTRFSVGRQVTDTLNIVSSLSQKLLVRVVAADGVRLSATEALKAVYRPTVRDGVEITAAHVRPGEDVTTWAVNTRTGATTEYSNFNFNSFGQVGHKYLGAARTGLYELNGDDDQGTDIIAKIRSGYAQFNGSRYTGFKAAYLGMRADGSFVFKLETGTGEVTAYNVVAQDMQTTKIQVGKGLRARYFAFELVTTGQDFDLDTVEFVPMPAQRRV